MKVLPVLQSYGGRPAPLVSVLPVVFLIGSLLALLIVGGTDLAGMLGWGVLLLSAALALLLSRASGTLSRRELVSGLHTSASQVLPALPLLLLIALISTTWMLSGVVPALICYGLDVINPTMFPVLACVVSALVSSLTGSSWTSVATVGVAFMGIGGAMDYSAAVTAGAVISGAYFGDKVSPLSDTTVVAASTCGVEIFRHVKYMMRTSLPAMFITLLVYLAIGLLHRGNMQEAGGETIPDALKHLFVISPEVLIIPAVTVALIAFRVNTMLTLGISAAMGLIGIFVFQAGVVDALGGAGGIAQALWSGPEFTQVPELLSRLAQTSGVWGMWPTALLVLSALLFGGVMIGTGMLASITAAFTKRLRSRFSTVGATTGSGLLLVACTADQYLSLIVGGNMYGTHYASRRLDSRLLSRTLEDSVTVTCPLFPWSSCGVMHSAVLGVGAIAYAPFALFCWLSPLMAVAVARFGRQKGD